MDDLNDLFLSGRPPRPHPDGFLSGSLVATTVARPVDSFARWLSGLYMPWLGKTFHADEQTGINRLEPSARSPLKLLWRNYDPKVTTEGALEAFPFTTRIAPGVLDPNLDVLKIDYDMKGNPSFVIRQLLDELVQIEDGVYLGKILYRTRNTWRAVGFFSLRSGSSS